MKNKLFRGLLLVLSLLLFVSSLPAEAASPREKGTYVEIKSSGKTTTVKKPPFVIQFTPLEIVISEPGANYFSKVVVTLEGEQANMGDSLQGSSWTFNLNIDSVVRVNAGPLSGSNDQYVLLYTVIDHQTSAGSGKATITNMAGKTGEEFVNPLDQDREKQEKKKKEKAAAAEKARKLSKMTPEERKAELEKQKNPPPRDVYKTSFTIDGNGGYAPDCQLLQQVSIPALEALGAYTPDPPAYYDEANGDDAKQYIGNIKYQIDFTINDKDYVTATINFTASNGYPVKFEMKGTFTSKSEKEIKQKLSMKLPVWGTWTNGNVYAAVPKVLDDHAKRQLQLAAKVNDPSAKVDEVKYNNGKWLTLKQGPKKLKKNDFEVTKEHYSYVVLEITDTYIYYETGVLNFPPGTSLKLIPEVRYKFPRDHQNNLDLYSQPLETYARSLEPTLFSLKYNSYSDTIMPSAGFFSGFILHRVKEAPVVATWANVKDVEKPDASNIREKAGVWYDFKVEKGAYVDGIYVPSKAGGYTFERVTVNGDGSAEVISGRAEIYSFDDTLHLYVQNRTVYDRSGASEETVYEPELDEDGEEDEDFEYESFTVRYADYDKTAGLIKFNGAQFYKVTKATIHGSWTTHEDIPPTPDTSKEAARAALMEYYTDSVEWLKFDSPSRTFTRVLWASNNGQMELLIEKGVYSTRGDNQIVLDEITATCYSADNELIFEDVPDPYSTETLVYHTQADNDDVLSVSGIGKMYKYKGSKS